MEKQTMALIMIAIVSLILNLTIIGFVGKWKSNKRSRRLVYLLCNLCIAFVFGSVSAIIGFSGADKMLNEKLACSLGSYMINFNISIISLTVLLISCECRKKFKKDNSSDKDIFLSIAVIWCVAGVSAIPTWFTTGYEDESECCVKKILMNSLITEIIQEIVRCIIFHVTIPVLVGWELYKIRSKFKLCYKLKAKTTSLKMMKTVQNVRFMYTHSAIFILLWFPIGILISYYRIFEMPGITNCLNPDNTNHPIYYAVGIAFCIYIIICPVLIYSMSGMFYVKKTPMRLVSPQIRRCRSCNKVAQVMGGKPVSISTWCEDNGSMRRRSMEMMDYGKINGADVVIFIGYDMKIKKEGDDIVFDFASETGGRKETLI